MEISYGVEVVDKNGKVIGAVNHVVHDTWTGGIRKFFVYRESPNVDPSFSPDDILEATESKVSLKIAFNESGEKLE